MNDDLEKLFSAIDSVPWPRIEHAFGPVTDIPDLIRSLTSPDVNLRNDAWSKLHGNIWHQGTIYEATSYACLLGVAPAARDAWQAGRPRFPRALWFSVNNAPDRDLAAHPRSHSRSSGRVHARP
jgi:hypothetical protein